MSYRRPVRFRLEETHSRARVGSFLCAQWECRARKRANVERKYSSRLEVPQEYSIRESSASNGKISCSIICVINHGEKIFYNVKSRQANTQTIVTAGKRILLQMQLTHIVILFLIVVSCVNKILFVQFNDMFNKIFERLIIN